MTQSAPAFALFANQPATILAPNAAFARALRVQAEADAASTNGSGVWLSPRILTFSAWVRELWMEAIWHTPGDAVLLNPAQELQLWKRVILESEEADRLLQVDAAAKLASDAWRTLHAWRIPWTPSAFEHQEDPAAFYRWSRRFAQLCEQKNWIDEARLPDLCDPQRIDGDLIVNGFVTLTPQQRTFLDRVAPEWTAGQAPDPLPSVDLTRAPFASLEDEAHAAAFWCNERAAQGKRIAVVCASVAAHRALLDRVFLEVFHPAQRLLLDNPDAPRLYSAGNPAPLSRDPLVQTAILALRLSRGDLPLAEAGSLLRSPYLGRGLQERAGRAVLDAELRKTHPEHLSLAAIVTAAKAKAPLLANLLGKFDKVRRGAPKSALPSAWASLFSRMLRALDWPGSETLHASAQASIEAWHDVLSEYASLDAISGAENLASALHTLSSLAASKTPAAAGPLAPVQILNAREAEGLRFDALWIFGCTADQWPQPPRPNPFLPIALQRARGIPGSSPEIELENARRTVHTLRHSAPEVVFSHATRDGERDLRPSPLISAIAAELPPPDGPQRTSKDDAQFEEADDWQGPAVIAGAKQRGGTRILLLQAECPFRAFAELRLGLRALESGEPGLNPRDRGKLLHDVLQMVWSQLQSSSRLQQTSSDELGEIVRGAIRQCQAATPPRDAFEREILQLEAERLRDVILEWLQSEKKRGPFVVVGQEHARTVELGNLRFDARVDRVDRLPDGSELIIDYKTGEIPADPWSGERMSEPQMPVYAVSHPNKVGGLLFGLVSSGAMELKGMQPGSAMPIEEWRRVVTNLANDFAAGVARLDPKTYPQTCQYCDAASLCRVGDVRA